MTDATQPTQPATVPDKATPAGAVRARWGWTAAEVWTERMLTTLEQGVSMVGFGLLLGAMLSFWATRALDAMVFASDGLDVVTIGLAALLLIVTGAVAALPAALRAARTDPLIALRAE